MNLYCIWAILTIIIIAASITVFYIELSRETVKRWDSAEEALEKSREHRKILLSKNIDLYEIIKKIHKDSDDERKDRIAELFKDYIDRYTSEGNDDQ